MVSPSKPNHSKVANKSTSYKCKLVKGSKPLINFKFYLDIENINISNKIENKIRELGGSIEFFLAKEVTHFITDKQLKTDSSKSLASVCVSSPKTPATPQTPRTSIIIDLAAISSPTHDSKAQTSKQRSRADAMLQRARLQKQDSLVQYSQSKSQSPVQIAKTFGTPIWTTEYALRFFEKVFNDIKSQSPNTASTSRSKELNNNLKLEYHHNHHHHRKSSSSNPNHVRVLKGNYIKIESLESRNYRPVYRELKYWPKINLLALNSNSPFDSEVQQVTGTQQDMTRKNNRSKQQPQAKTKTNQPNQDINQKQKNHSDSKPQQQQQHINGGYCEICRVEYDSLRQHIKSDVHLSFIKNDTNFIALDHLIKNTSNVDDFLKLRSKVVEQCTKKEEIINESVNRRATLKRNSSNNPFARDLEIKKEKLDDDRIVHSNGELSLDGTRRSRRESCRRINYAEPREDEENSNDQIVIETLPKNNTTLNLRKSIRWLPPSPDERPPISKPIMYKVDTKLLNEKESKKEPLSEKNKSDSRSGNVATDAKSEKIKMKLTRVRQSELSLLSDEAENFMFPKRELSDSEDTDDDRQSTSEPAEISNEIISSELVDSAKTSSQSQGHVKNHKLDSNSRPRRRNQLELFIKDNTDYYKFEHLNSRLRFQEAPTQPETIKTETDEGFSEKPDLDDTISISSPPVNVKTDDRVGVIGPSNNNIIIHQLNTKIDAKYKYSFERIPINEPWYSAFQRQDEGKEKIFEYYGSTAYRKLPFEMGPLLTLQQNCCLLNRDPSLPPPATISRASSSIPPSPLTSNTNDLLLEIDIDDNSNSNNSNSNKLNNNSINSSNNNNKLNQKRLNYLTKRKMMIMESCHPRKSPREHASTLAILSSIVRDEPRDSQRKSSKGNSISSSVDHNNRDDDDVLLNENSMDSIQSEVVTVEPQVLPPQPASSHNDRKEHSQSPLCYEFDDSTFKSSNRLCYEIDKFLKFSYSDTGVDEIPKLAGKSASNLLIQKAEKDENSFYAILNKIHECEIDSEIDVNHIFDETTKINKIHEMLMMKKMSNHQLTITERLHLARMARRRKYNRTGWPRSRYVPKNLNSSSSSRNLRKPQDVVKIRGRPRLSDEEKHRRLLERKLNSDMFTISSDSLDSSSQVLLNNKEEEELDSVSTRSMFVSDDESFVDAVEDPNALDEKMFFDAPSKIDEIIFEDEVDEQPTTLSDIKEESIEEEVNSIQDIPKYVASPPPRIPSPLPPPETEVDEEKKEVDVIQNKNGLISNIIAKAHSKFKTLTCYVKLEDDIAKTYGLRSSLGKGEKVTVDTSVILSKTSPSNKTNKNSSNTKRTGSPQKTSNVHSPQFSPRKLRKPRGRWYRER